MHGFLCLFLVHQACSHRALQLPGLLSAFELWHQVQHKVWRSHNAFKVILRLLRLPNRLLPGYSWARVFFVRCDPGQHCDQDRLQLHCPMALRVVDQQQQLFMFGRLVLRPLHRLQLQLDCRQML